MAEAAERFCGRWFRCNRNQSVLVLCGESNCGKSHTASAIFRFCTVSAMKALEDGFGETWPDHVPSSTFVRFPEVADEIRNKNYSSVEDMKESDMLVIDDIGAENDPFKEVSNVLCQVLTRRERKFTVITTNIRIQDWPTKFDTRIADRLFRNSAMVDLFGIPSYATL